MIYILTPSSDVNQTAVPVCIMPSPALLRDTDITLKENGNALSSSAPVATNVLALSVESKCHTDDKFITLRAVNADVF
jgi:hypothetical protein